MPKEYTPEFKAKLALAVLCGEKTVVEISANFGVHQTLICKWAKQLKDSATDIFSGEAETELVVKEKRGKIHSKIGQLTEEERTFLLKSLAE